MPQHFTTLTHNGYSISMRDLVRLQHPSRALTMNIHKRSYGYQSGRYFSALHGRGIEFAEVRLYQPGDEIRNMDWRVTARTGKPHTKLYHPERDRTIFIVVDYSASMFFGTRVAFKSVIAAQIAGLLAWSAVAQGNRVGGFIFGDKHPIELRPRTRQAGVLPLLKALADESHQAPIQQQMNALNNTLALLTKTAKPGSSIFLLSDFAQLTTESEKYLSQLRKENDVHAGFIYDQLEREPPPPNQYAVTNGNNILLIDTAQSAFCDQYRQAFAIRRDFIIQTMHRNGISLMELATHDDVLAILQRGLKKDYRK